VSVSVIVTSFMPVFLFVSVTFLCCACIEFVCVDYCPANKPKTAHRRMALRLTLSNDCTATHCNTLQHTATLCNALQHTATQCNTGAGLWNRLWEAFRVKWNHKNAAGLFYGTPRRYADSPRRFRGQRSHIKHDCCYGNSNFHIQRWYAEWGVFFFMCQ